MAKKGLSSLVYMSDSVCSLCCGLSDQFLQADLLSYFLFQPVMCNWCNKGHGIYYRVNAKDPLLLISNNRPWSDGSGFSLSLSVWYINHTISI